jgi:hypothetical protein
VIQIDKDEAFGSGRISPPSCGDLACTSERFLPFYHYTQQQDKLCLYLHNTMLLKSQIITRPYRLVTRPATDNRLSSTCGTIQQWKRPDAEARYHNDPQWRRRLIDASLASGITSLRKNSPMGEREDFSGSVMIMIGSVTSFLGRTSARGSMRRRSSTTVRAVNS